MFAIIHGFQKVAFRQPLNVSYPKRANRIMPRNQAQAQDFLRPASIHHSHYTSTQSNTINTFGRFFAAPHPLQSILCAYRAGSSVYPPAFQTFARSLQNTPHKLHIHLGAKYPIPTAARRICGEQQNQSP